MLNRERRSIVAVATAVSCLLNATIAVNAQPKKYSAFDRPIEISGTIAEGMGAEKNINCQTMSVNVWEYIEIPDRAGTLMKFRIQKKQLSLTKPRYRSADATCQYQIVFTPSKNIPSTAKRYIDIVAVSNVKPPTQSLAPDRVCDYRNQLRLHESNPIPISLDFFLKLTCSSSKLSAVSFQLVVDS